MFWIIAALVALMAVGYFVFPASIKGFAPDPATLEDFSFPTNDEDRPITHVYGTCLIHPNLLWYGDLESVRRRKDGTTIGYGYYLSMIWGIGGEIDEVLQLRMNDEIICDWRNVVKITLTNATWTKSTKRLVQTGAFTNYTWQAGDRIVITGGDDADIRPGMYSIAARIDDDTIEMEAEIGPDSTGVTSDPRVGYCETGVPAQIRPSESVSMVRWTDGSQSSIDSYYQTATGRATHYPGVSLLLMAGSFVGDDVRTVPAYSLLVRRVPRILQPEAETNYSEIEGDSNAADVLYDLYVHEIGVPAGMMDAASWQAGQEILYHEGLGVSVPMHRSKTFEDWQKDILRHVDGHVYFDEASGKFKLKLVRNDFDEGSLPVLTQSHYGHLEIDRGGWDSCFSDLQIKWTSRKDYQLTAYNLVNPASIEVLGHRKQETISFPYLTRSATAARRLAMIRPRYFLPLATMTFRVSRKAVAALEANLNPGEVFMLSSSALGITEMICRVVGVVESDRRESRGYLEIEAIEDFSEFSADDIPEIPEPEEPESSELTLPVRYPLALGASRVLGQHDTLKRLYFLGVKPSLGATTEFEIWNRQGIGGLSAAFGMVERVAYCGYATLKTELGNDGKSRYYLREGVEIQSGVNIRTGSLSDATFQAGRMAFLLAPVGLTDTAALTEGYEIVLAKQVLSLGGGDYALTDLIRGVGGTPAREHPVGTRVYQLPSTVPVGDHYLEMVDYQGFTGTPPFYFAAWNHANTGPWTIYQAGASRSRVLYPLPAYNVRAWRFATEDAALTFAGGGALDDNPAGEYVLLAWMPAVRGGNETPEDEDLFEELEDYEGRVVLTKVSGSGTIPVWQRNPLEGTPLVQDLGEISETMGRYVLIWTGSGGPIELSLRAYLGSSYYSEYALAVTV